MTICLGWPTGPRPKALWGARKFAAKNLISMQRMAPRTAAVALVACLLNGCTAAVVNRGQGFLEAGRNATIGNVVLNKTIFCPAPHNLEEWKEHSGCCVAHCGSMGDKCFKGCLSDCVKMRLDCTGLVLKGNCFNKCKELKPCNACLDTVTPGDTADCNMKCMKTFGADVQGDKCPLR